MFRLFAILLFAGTLASLPAQVFTGRLTGVVTDPSGAAVVSAKVVAVQTETEARKIAGADSTGAYSIPLLLPGHYDVTVDAAGFQSQIGRNIELGANQTVTLDFKLTLAANTTQVEVTGEAPLLQSEAANVGNTVSAKTIDELPMLQRDVMSLVATMPGVVAKSQVGDARGGRNVFDSNFSVAGGRTSTNEVLLDGAANTIGDFNGVVVVPPPDSVQEFRVETNSYSAEFGRSGGGVVNIVTKAGTNRYHGTMLYYHQNDAFNANTFSNNRFGTPKSVLRRHQYGFTLGGPVWIPGVYKGNSKTFFFAGFEGRRERDPVNQIASVPTQAQRSGDFSRLVFLSSSGAQPIILYDPFTSRIENGARTRDPFPNNVIPAPLINPVARKAVDLYPAPNRIGSSVTGFQNYQFRDSRTYSRDLFSARVDHYFSDRHRIFFRTSFQENLDTNPSLYVRFTNSNSVWDHFKNYALDDTWQISPHLSGVFRYSYARFRANQISNSAGYDPTVLGLPAYLRDQANVLFMPNFAIGGTFPDLGGTAYNNQPRDTQGFQQSLFYATGRHNIRSGGEYRLYRFYPFQVFNPTGGFSFGSAFTQRDHLAATTAGQGFGFASFLLATGSFSFEHVEPLSAYHHYMATWVQDDYKVSRRLTLNLGLRWEAETGTGESHNRLSYFDPSAANPLQGGPKGALVFAGTGGNPSTLRATNWTNFGPRLGVAYRLTPRTAIRAGYGIYFLPLGLEPTIVTTPYNYTVNANTTNADYTPRVTLSDPFPGGIPKPASSAPPTDGSYQLGNIANIVLRDQPAPYQQQWNFAIGRQFTRGMVVDATYLGSRGVHLPIPSLELNQIDPKNLAQGGNYLTDLVPNPWFGQFAGGLLSQRTIPRMQLLKPFPQFASFTTANAFGGSLNFLRPPVGDSIYHAVTLRFERRFTRGFSLTAHYTIAKLLDTGGVGNGNAFNDPSALRDVFNTRLERSVGSFDVPQRMVVFYSVDVPAGKGKRFLKSGSPKWLERTVGGWTFFAYHTVQAGFPVAVGGPDTSRIAGASPSRASVVAGVQPAYSRDTELANTRSYNPACGCTQPWFNPAAFVTTPQFVLPNGPRFLPNVRADILRNMDLSLYKSIRINERMRFSLQGRFFNVLNQVTFTGPSVTTVNSANFGSAGGEAGNPRRMEVGAKLYF